MVCCNDVSNHLFVTFTALTVPPMTRRQYIHGRRFLRACFKLTANRDHDLLLVSFIIIFIFQKYYVINLFHFVIRCLGKSRT